MQIQHPQEALKAARLEIDRLKMLARNMDLSDTGLRLEIARLHSELSCSSHKNAELQAENKTLKLAQSLIPETVGIVN